jgi:hypothetical protein
LVGRKGVHLAGWSTKKLSIVETTLLSLKGFYLLLSSAVVQLLWMTQMEALAITAPIDFQEGTRCSRTVIATSLGFIFGLVSRLTNAAI